MYRIHNVNVRQSPRLLFHRQLQQYASCRGKLESLFTSFVLMMFKSIIMSMFGVLLLMIGSACMLTDALGTPVQYIINLILDLIKSDYSNNIAANEAFLDNLYRIVRSTQRC